MAEEKKWISDITEENIEGLRRKTALTLPDSPVGSGMRAAAVKPRFYEALTEGDVSFVAFLRRVILEANAALALLDRSIGDDAQSLADHKEDDKAHQELFAAVAKEATDALDGHAKSGEAHKTLFKNVATDVATAVKNDTISRISLHDSSTSAHQNLFNKGVLHGIIDMATKDQDGLMSKEQFGQLATLVALLENDDADVTINTIKEVLKAFEGYDNGTLIANLLAKKLDTGHNTSDNAHAELFSALSERVTALENESGGGAGKTHTITFRHTDGYYSTAYDVLANGENVAPVPDGYTVDTAGSVIFNYDEWFGSEDGPELTSLLEQGVHIIFAGCDSPMDLADRVTVDGVAINEDDVAVQTIDGYDCAVYTISGYNILAKKGTLYIRKTVAQDLVDAGDNLYIVRDGSYMDFDIIDLFYEKCDVVLDLGGSEVFMFKYDDTLTLGRENDMADAHIYGDNSWDGTMMRSGTDYGFRAPETIYIEAE